MTCNHVGVENKPFDWQQVEQLYSGKPGGTITRDLLNGIDKDGTGHWYAIQIVGQSAHYQVSAEETSQSTTSPDSPASTEPSNDDSSTKKKKRTKSE